MAESELLEGASLLVCCHGGQANLKAFSKRLQPLLGQAGLAAVESCALFGKPSLEDSLKTLEKQQGPVYLVPFFLAEGITLAALSDRLALLRAKGHATDVHISPIFGLHPNLVPFIRATCLEALEQRNWKADDTALLLVGHGTRRNPASRQRLEALVAELSDLPLKDLACAFLEEEPDIDTVLKKLREKQILALGCFTEQGRHALEDVPEALEPHGERVHYLGPLGAAPWVPEMLLDLARIRAQH